MATAIKPDSELHAIAAEQRRELLAFQAVESDLDLAFDLQLQEAITASLSLFPSSSSVSPPSTRQFLSNDNVLNLSALQVEELEKFEREHEDHLLTEAENKKARDDLHRRIYDHKVASEINCMSEDEWEEYGDNFERPYVECSSNSQDATFRIYFKGLVSEDMVSDSKAAVIGIGVAICDEKDDLVVELRKSLLGNGKSRHVAEVKALIEGLNAAVALDLKRVVFYCDYTPLYQFVIGRWLPKQQKIATLISQVNLLQRKFLFSAPALVARNDIKFAFKLAREAIISQINKPLGPSSSKNLYETCVICLDDIGVGQIFSVDGCLHRYCFSCMKQHVEVKLLNGLLPKCPHEGCNSKLNIESCLKFLTPRLIEIMSQRLKEASIPVTEKVYCPYPNCSALMSKSEVLEYSKAAFLGTAERLEVRKCAKCEGLFCINCKVPWHNNMSCCEYKRKNPYPRAEDAKLKTLADRNLWRQCVKCNHMIELATGCYHMTCRCGYEFCYTCGAEWKKKTATCSCPLFDDADISDDELDFDLDDDDDYYDDDDDVYYDGYIYGMGSNYY